MFSFFAFSFKAFVLLVLFPVADSKPISAIYRQIFDQLNTNEELAVVFVSHVLSIAIWDLIDYG